VAKGWTQVKLAHELRCVGFRMVMRWEAGQAPPSMEASQALARVFRCRLEHVCEMVLRSATRIRNVPAGKGAVV
jgi:transcriptional regulator with XRE-family HTH domain